MATCSAETDETRQSETSLNVFISYQWKSQLKVKQLYAELAARQCLNVFMDIYKIQAGMNLYFTLASNLQQADVILACVSREYVKSKNCEREIIYADAFNKPIIPLYVEKIPMNELGSIGFILVRERYCNLYKNAEVFENLSNSDELRDILDGIQNASKIKGVILDLSAKLNLNVSLKENNINEAVVKFRNDQPVDLSFISEREDNKSTINTENQENNKATTNNKLKTKKNDSQSNKRTQTKVNYFLEMHPLIKELKFLWHPRVHLDPKGDNFCFEADTNLSRGNQAYHRPVAWIRYGLKISKIYPDCSKWLSSDGNPGEWAVVYHGFKSNPLRGSLYKKLFDKNAELNPQLENSKNPKYINEMDINPKGLGYKQACGLGIFCTSKPHIAEENTALFIFNEIKYKMLLQCRADPKRIRIPKTNKDLFIINSPNYIRPYALLIKEIQ